MSETNNFRKCENALLNIYLLFVTVFPNSQQLFVAAGGELLDEHKVTEIVPGQVVTVRTAKGSFRTKKLVITVGPWAPKLLKTIGVELPFEVGVVIVNINIFEFVCPK